MSDTIHDSKIPEDKKVILVTLVQTLLNEINTKITHLGINNYVKLQEDISKILVPIIEEKLD